MHQHFYLSLYLYNCTSILSSNNLAFNIALFSFDSSYSTCAVDQFVKRWPHTHTSTSRLKYSIQYSTGIMGVLSSTNDRHGFFGAAYYFTKTKLLNDIGHFGSSPIFFCFEGSEILEIHQKRCLMCILANVR